MDEANKRPTRTPLLLGAILVIALGAILFSTNSIMVAGKDPAPKGATSLTVEERAAVGDFTQTGIDSGYVLRLKPDRSYVFFAIGLGSELSSPTTGQWWLFNETVVLKPWPDRGLDFDLVISREGERISLIDKRNHYRRATGR
jgi:hypothetical protein